MIQSGRVATHCASRTLEIMLCSNMTCSIVARRFKGVLNFCRKAEKLAGILPQSLAQDAVNYSYCLHFFHNNELFMTTSAATQSRELSIMSSVGVSSVDCSTTAIRRLLAKAQELKPNGGVEPALTAPEFDGGIEEIGKQSGGSNKDYAAIETACRNIFYTLLVKALRKQENISTANSLRHQPQSTSPLSVRYGTFSTLYLSSLIQVSLTETFISVPRANSAQRFVNQVCSFGSSKSCLTPRL